MALFSFARLGRPCNFIAQKAAQGAYILKEAGFFNA
jgi:hypothetical protein